MKHNIWTLIFSRYTICLTICFSMLIAGAKTANSADPAPGESCSTINANGYQWSGGPENAGTLYGMFCKSNIWSNAITFMSSGYIGIGTATPGALLDVGKAGTTLGTARFEGNTSGYVQIQPSAAAGSWTMTLPGGAGNNGYFLQTNGSGVTSWAAASGGGGNLGTSKTAASPQVSGDATSGFYYTGVTGQVAVTNSGVETLQWNPTASGVNYFTMAAGAAGSAPTLGNAGSDTAGAGLGLTISAKAATATGGGGTISLSSGAGSGTGAGGANNINGGAGGATGTGGNVTITSGAGGSTSGDTGIITLQGGTPTSGNGGDVNLTGSNGVGTNKSGGNINLTTGAKTGTGTAGTVYITGHTGIGTAADTNNVLSVGGQFSVAGNVYVSAGGDFFQVATNSSDASKIWLGDGTNNNVLVIPTGTSTGARQVGILTTTPQASLDVNGFARLKMNSSAPATCASSNQGSIALTHLAQVCVCDTANVWHILNTSTACSW